MDLVKLWCEGGLDISVPGYDLLASYCEHGNENSGSIKAWEFLD